MTHEVRAGEAAVLFRLSVEPLAELRVARPEGG